MSQAACCKPAFFVFLVLTVAACANDLDVEEDRQCFRAICGCWDDHSMRTTVSIVDGEGQPAPGVTLSCAADQQVFGTSGPAGVLRLVAAGRVSPGCGFVAECEIAALTVREGELLQTFALTPLLRGEKVVAGVHTLSATPANAERE